MGGGTPAHIASITLYCITFHDPSHVLPLSRHSSISPLLPYIRRYSRTPFFLLPLFLSLLSSSSFLFHFFSTLPTFAPLAVLSICVSALFAARVWKTSVSQSLISTSVRPSVRACSSLNSVSLLSEFFSERNLESIRCAVVCAAGCGWRWRRGWCFCPCRRLLLLLL